MGITTISITPGSGKNVAVDDASGTEAQIVKLSLDALGTVSSTLTVGQTTMAASLPVAVASDQKLTAGGITTEIDAAITMSTAGAYTTGDFVGTNATALTFANAARVSGGTGIILSAVLIDKALQSISGELWLFDTSVTPPNDNAAWSLSDADAARCIGIIPFGVYYASALNSVSQSQALGMAFKSSATSLWGCFVTRGAPTYASSDLVVRLTISQD